MRRFFTFAVVATVLALALAPVAAGKTTRVPVQAFEYVSAPPFMGDYSLRGNVESIRGMVLTYTVTGSDLLAGTDTVVVNYNLNLKSGSGALWGTNRLEPSAHPGGHFDCSWQGTFHNFAWTGKTVCHGAGSLRGWQLRVAILPEPGGMEATVDGFAFLPGT